MAVIDAVNKILSVFPERWPIPLPASAIIVVALTLSINTWVVFDKAKDFILDNEFIKLKGRLCGESSFDYIVVGAGTAGMVVSTRIANASKHATILLLEAGGEPSILNQLPSMDFFLLNQPANTWIYNTTPQQYSCGHCDDRKSLTTRGKMLGGSTGTNFMMWVRGNKEDFNRWTDDTGGDPQWSYKALLPYFRKSEDYNGAYTHLPDSHIYHGRGGLLNIATHDYMPGISDLLAAAREKGYRVGDYNGDDQEVFSPIDVTTQNGWRENTYRAFYKDTGKPSNLCIRKYAQVVRVDVDTGYSSGNPRATGVTYMKHKKYHHVWARKEVILSAGVFETPKILLMSGVGPKDDLESLNIPVVRDLPVGRNLQDHTYTIVGPFLKSPSLNPNRDVTVQAATKFLLSGTGSLAAPAGLAGTAFFQSPVAQPSYPDLQVVQFSVALYPELPRDLNRFFGIRESILYQWFDPFHRLNTDARFMVLWLGRPKSVGNLRLASRNPKDNPIIDPQYLQHPDDIEALLYGFKKVVDLFENTSAINTPIFPKPVPGCENHVFKSDLYYRCVIRHFSGSLYHHVGTVALGKCLDNNLKVKGIDGLRVIDSSAIPRTPNGNTASATVMLAEKGADLVIHGDGYKGWGEADPVHNEIPGDYFDPRLTGYKDEVGNFYYDSPVAPQQQESLKEEKVHPINKHVQASSSNIKEVPLPISSPTPPSIQQPSLRSPAPPPSTRQPSLRHSPSPPSTSQPSLRHSPSLPSTRHPSLRSPAQTPSSPISLPISSTLAQPSSFPSATPSPPLPPSSTSAPANTSAAINNQVNYNVYYKSSTPVKLKIKSQSTFQPQVANASNTYTSNNNNSTNRSRTKSNFNNLIRPLMHSSSTEVTYTTPKPKYYYIPRNYYYDYKYNDYLQRNQVYEYSESNNRRMWQKYQPTLWSPYS